MRRTVPRLALWGGRLTVSLLAVALVLGPTPAQPQAPPADKQKQIEAIQKQIADLQKQLADAQKPTPTPAAPAVPEGTLPDAVSKHFTWRNIGPANMGGRVTALAVVESDPSTYYVGTGAGGLLKTKNNGTTFEVLFSNQSTVAIGDVAVSPSNPDVVWVGTGEANPRNSVSYGDGVYKSTDAGKTFTKMGLEKTYQTGKILVHPTNPEIVYVGALGRLWGESEDRGLYKTIDGGKTWAKVLYVDNKTGVIDARLDPQNPDTLIVAMWERKRDEFDGFFGEPPVPDAYGPVVTHGAGGGLFKSTDAGKTWKKLTDDTLKTGLPTVKLGRIGLDYSRKTKGLIYAIIDTEKGGTGEPSVVYLGITPADTPAGAEAPKGAKIGDVTEGGPAEKGGLKAGDLITKVDAVTVERYDDFVDYFVQKQPGAVIQVTVKRKDKDEVLSVTLGKRDAPTTTTPAGPGGRGARTLPPITGVQFGTGPKLTIDAVTKGGPAEKAGVKVGDEVTAFDGKSVKDAKDYAVQITGKKAGDVVELTLRRATETLTVKITLAPNPRSPAAQVTPGGGTTPATLPLPGFAPALAQGPVTVATVLKDGPADKAGVKVGDVVTKVNGVEVGSIRSFLGALRVGPNAEDARKAGAKVKLTVKSGDKETELDLELVDVPFALPGGPARGVTANRPYGLGLGGQQANVQFRQGKDGHQTGGVFVSKDNGDTWARINSLNARPMYFSVVRVDPSDDNTVYALGDAPVLWRSTNAGKRFEPVSTARGVHADAHALWIDPANAKHLVIGCDGGFYVSYDKGNAWEHLNTLALGQFYHVAVDNRRPYRVYGGLQDNGSWGGPSHSLRSYGPVNEDWVYVSGGDGFVCRVDPTDPDLVYAESQGGMMNRRNFRTGESAFIRPRAGQGDEPLRFNWNTPFILSNHNPSIFYCGAQYVFRSVKKGDSLKQISPDLTRSKKGSMTAINESPRTPDVLWAGTDDGNLWVSKDGGAKWDNVSANLVKAGVPGPRWVATIEPSRDKDGRCYVVLDGHRSDDDKPYVMATEDFGATFTSLNANLPAVCTTRVLREDITTPDTLYLGTEFGAWVSINRGASWAKLGGNLPTVPVHEFAQPTVAADLVAATHGRSVWVADISTLRQLKPDTLKEPVKLFAPAPAVRWKLGAGGESPYSTTDRRFVGTNPAAGATLEYHLGKPAKKVALKVVDVAGKTVRTFDNPPATAGLHRVQWNLSSAPPQGGSFRRAASVQAAVYKVVLTVDEQEFTSSLAVEIDPNAPKDLVTLERFEDAEREYREEQEAAGRPAKRDE